MCVAIIKSAALYVASNPLIILVPIIMAIIIMLYWAYWITGFIYIYSIGTIQTSPYGPFASITWTADT